MVFFTLSLNPLTIFTFSEHIFVIGLQGTNAEFKYRLRGKNSEYFKIDGTGKITVAKDIDYENENVYSFKVSNLNICTQNLKLCIR